VNIGTATVIRGDARNLPLPDDSVDLIVTSPPYFALRSYQDGGQHYAGQIGDESTPAEFVDSLIEVTRECVRVLKPSGSLWVNLGDKYSQRVQIRRSSHQPGQFPGKFDEFAETWAERAAKGATRMPYQNIVNAGGGYVPEKSLMGIPWRYALRCIDDLGLILRAEVIWSKPNGLPESVTDRVRRSHEQWFHFTLEPRYFSAVDEVREAHVYPNDQRHLRGVVNAGSAVAHGNTSTCNALGKLPGSVRTVPTEPLRVPDHLGVDHFAAFPTAWPKWIIQGWAPTRGVCEACGEGRRPVVEKSVANFAGYRASEGHRQDGRGVSDASAGMDRPGAPVYSTRATITGHTCGCGEFGPNDCACCGEPATTTVSRGGTSVPVCLRHYNHWRTPTRPAVILDPFGGTGTTALVAKALGCHGISVDMSADYCRLAEWRTNDPGQLAKVLDVDKPPEVAANQTDLFDLIGGDAA
jgi:DNA modification methylase